MRLTVQVQDDRGERLFVADDFPLDIGGEDAAIRLDAVNGRLLARVGLQHDAPFLAPGDEPVQVNGTARPTPCWLRDGDILTFADGHVVFQRRGDQLGLYARSRGAGTLPPADAATDTDGGRVVIEPVAFHPARGAAAKSRRGTRALQAGVAVLAAMLFAATWFLFTARSVNVVVEPEPDALNIEDTLLKPRVGGRYLLRPGAYRVVAEKQGYVPLDAPIEVSHSSNQQFVLNMQKQPGRVSVSAGALRGAEVLIDGELIGQTPLGDIEVPAGLHRLVVRARNHLPHEQEIEVEGMLQEQSWQVSLQPNWAPVTLRSVPAAATVSLDGEAIGVTPLTAEIEAGDRELTVSAPGHESETLSLTVVAGEAQIFDAIVLPVADGLLVVDTTPAGVNVSVDGQFAGRSPLEIELSPERAHTVALAKPGYETATRRVELDPDETEELSVRLQPILGSLRIVTSPGDADIYVDGQPSGKGDRVLTLTAAPHRIEVRKEGYAAHVQTVTPRRNLEQRITVVLKTIAEAAAAELPETIDTVAGRLRLVRGGSLRMGSLRREQGRRSNEVRRDVELTREFYLAETEVTNAAFRQFMPTHSSGFFGGISLDGDDQPVVRISWQLAARFCNWLSERDGLPTAYVDTDGRLVAKRPMTTGYRLPSEAEWAWVARFAGGPRALRYPWGGELPPPDGAGNFADNAAASLVAQPLENYDDGFTVSAPVGTFPPNPLGFRELAGNVSEWTHDYYELAAVDPFLSLIDPLGPEFGDRHVIRGASWMKGNISDLRSASRDSGAQGRPDLGFRVARYAR